MSLRLLRRGEWLALAGAVGLLVVLFFDWFGIKPHGWATYHPMVQHLPAGGGIYNLLNTYGSVHVHHSGWSTLGWFLDVLLCISILGGLAIAYVTVRRTAPAWPVGASILTIGAGGIAFLVLLIRVLTQPGLGADLPDDVVTIQLPAYLGLLFAALIPVGAWQALADERTDAPESAYTPPPPRPVPGT